MRGILITEYNRQSGCQVAGRKKRGNLGDSIGVRLDRPAEALVAKVAQRSALGKNAVSEVMRVIVTAWLLEAEDPVEEFEPLAKRVHAWRLNDDERVLEAKLRLPDKKPNMG